MYIGSATLSDAELLTEVRLGHGPALLELQNRHRPAALSCARRLTRGTQLSAEAVVDEAFRETCGAVDPDAGPGPVESFEPHLLASVLMVFYRRGRSSVGRADRGAFGYKFLWSVGKHHDDASAGTRIIAARHAPEAVAGPTVARTVGSATLA